MTRHFATLKASQLRLPLTRAQMSLLTLTFKAPGRIHILYISKVHQQNAWFQLNCRIPLIVSVLLWHISKFTHKAWKSNANRVNIRNAKYATMKCRQSQSFSQGYRSNLPISLTYFIPKTKVYETQRPDAVVGTINLLQHISHLKFCRRHWAFRNGTQFLVLNWFSDQVYSTVNYQLQCIGNALPRQPEEK